MAEDYVCTHTGLPVSMCGHCNGTKPLERPEFHGRPEDDTPHLFKGRDTVEWRGAGQSTGTVGMGTVRHAASESGGYRGTSAPKSAWAREQVMRTLADLPKDVQDIVEEGRKRFHERRLAVLLAGVDAPAPAQEGRKILGVDTRVAPSKNRAPAIPDGAVPSKWHWHHSGTTHKTESEQHQRGARNPGRTATRAHFRTRT